jgi:hypothetical protein
VALWPLGLPPQLVVAVGRKPEKGENDQINHLSSKLTKTYYLVVFPEICFEENNIPPYLEVWAREKMTEREDAV